jgi:ankyrin repeat protein
METMVRALQTKDFVLLKKAVETKGADINSKFADRVGFCPLASAVSEKWLDGVLYLIKSKADVNAKHSDGWSVLQESVFHRDNAKITHLLLENGADANSVTYQGLNALFIASTDRTLDSLLLICKVTKNIELRDPDGRTALERAVCFNHRIAASILLDAGAKTSSFSLKLKPRDWFTTLLAKRKNMKRALIVFYHLGRKNKCLGKDITNMIGKMVWETRDRDEWDQKIFFEKKNKK